MMTTAEQIPFQLILNSGNARELCDGGTSICQTGENGRS